MGRVIVGRVIVGRVIVGRVIVGRVNGNHIILSYLLQLQFQKNFPNLRN